MNIIKIECGFPPSFCIGCNVCHGRGYILVEDEVDIRIGDVDKCGNNPAWLHYVPNPINYVYATPIIYLFIPSSHVINGIVRATFGGVETRANVEDIIFDCLEHETIHYLLAKMLNFYESKKLENVHKDMMTTE